MDELIMCGKIFVSSGKGKELTCAITTATGEHLGTGHYFVDLAANPGYAISEEALNGD